MKNKLPELTECQKNRLEEVRFYLIYSRLVEYLSDKNSNKQEVLLNLFECLKVDQNKIFNAYAVLNRDMNKPTILEKSLTLTYIEYPTRITNKYLVPTRKYNTTINMFINTPITIRSGYMHSLLEKDYPALLEEIKNFNHNLKEIELILKLSEN